MRGIDNFVADLAALLHALDVVGVERHDLVEGAARGLAGRLIPVPRALTADCGMAWRAEIDRRAALEALAAGEGLEVEGFYELTL